MAGAPGPMELMIGRSRDTSLYHTISNPIKYLSVPTTTLPDLPSITMPLPGLPLATCLVILPVQWGSAKVW